jgi:hypothetical protein
MTMPRRARAACLRTLPLSSMCLLLPMPPGTLRALQARPSTTSWRAAPGLQVETGSWIKFRGLRVLRFRAATSDEAVAQASIRTELHRHW